MALATVTHHSFQVGTAHDALRSQKPVTSAGGMRPPPLVEERPQVRVQRHTVEQRIEHTPYVQILDAPVPQKVEQLVDVFKDLDSHVLVQVIEVPKISQDIIPQRCVDLVPQMVEQLVEVPTVLTPTRIAVQIAEQIVGIPIPRGRHGRSPGSLPGQGSTASAAEQIADIPSSSGDLQGFRPGHSSTAVSEQNVSTPAPCRGGLRGGLHGFPPVQGSAVDFPVPLGDADEGVFRKSARVGARSRSELAAHSSSSTPGACGVVSPVQSQQVDQVRGLVEYFSVGCEFLQMLDGEWQSLGHGVARLLRHSRRAVFFQFWRGEQPIVYDVVQSVGRPRLVLRPGRSGRSWAWSDPEYTCGPSEYGHAVRFASQELARRFHHEWATTG